jgi:hypothetical protein
MSTALVMAALIACAVLVASARGWLAPRLSARPAAVPARASSAARPGRQQGSTVQAEIITITRRGFEPAEITRAAGRFILMVENRSGLEEVTFRLDQENGSRVYEVALPQEKPDWSEVVDLQPGVYVLTEANHADWLARITIAAE